MSGDDVKSINCLALWKENYAREQIFKPQSSNMITAEDVVRWSIFKYFVYSVQTSKQNAKLISMPYTHNM